MLQLGVKKVRKGDSASTTYIGTQIIAERIASPLEHWISLNDRMNRGSALLDKFINASSSVNEQFLICFRLWEQVLMKVLKQDMQQRLRWVVNMNMCNVFVSSISFTLIVLCDRSVSHILCCVMAHSTSKIHVRLLTVQYYALFFLNWTHLFHLIFSTVWFAPEFDFLTISDLCHGHGFHCEASSCCSKCTVGFFHISVLWVDCKGPNTSLTTNHQFICINNGIIIVFSPISILT